MRCIGFIAMVTGGVLGLSAPLSGDSGHTPADIVGIDIDVRGSVHTWFADGTRCVGTVRDLDAYERDVSYAMGDGWMPVEMAILSDGAVLTRYADGSATKGTIEDLQADDTEVPLPSAVHHVTAEIVGLGCGARAGVLAWDRNGRAWGGVSSADQAPWTREYALPHGRSPGNIVAMAVTGVAGTVYAWYDDGTVSAGTWLDLGATMAPVEYSIDAIDLRVDDVILPGRRGAARVWYEVVGGVAYAYGDIELGPAGEPWSEPPPHQRLPPGVQPRTLRGPSTADLYDKFPAHLWWGGVIPYEIKAGLFERNEVRLIEQAAELLSKRTCLSVVPRTSEPDSVIFTRPARAGAAGSSPVGRRGGAQSIRLNLVRTDVVLHEILHSAGLWHEHSRTDRNRFIDVIVENIEPQGISNFVASEAAIVPGVPYDLDSIMHYSGTACGKTGPDGLPLPTLVLRRTGEPVEESVGLSRLDIQRLDALYTLTVTRKDKVFIARPDGNVEAWSWSKSEHAFIPSAYPFDCGHRPGGSLLTADIMDDVREELVAVGGDGNVELLSFEFNSPPQVQRRLDFHRPTPPGSFAIADVCGGGESEILVATGDTVGIWGIAGGKLIQASDPIDVEGGQPFSIAAVKVASRGKASVLVRHADGNVELIGCGRRQRQTLPDLADYAAFEQLAVGDVLGDERDEIVLMDDQSGSIALVRPTADVLSRVRVYESDFRAGDAFVLGDVLGDDKEELVHASATTGRVHILGWAGRRIVSLGESFDARFDDRAGLAVGLPTYRP